MTRGAPAGVCAIASRTLVLALALHAMSPLVSAYYHYVFFAGGTGPYTPQAAHFDLTATKDKALQYFISDAAPGPLTPGDTTTAIYSEIRQAAEVWNGVASSSARLHFGGTRNVSAGQTAPGIDVVFDDNLPPGIIAQTTLTFPADLSFLGANNRTFVPILRAKLQLRKDLTAAGYPQPSYSDAFFGTLVHEFGHSLGLQHTFTSAAMSTAITRATTRGAPLAPDDIAGISLLYPAGGFAASTGSITGQLTADGAGINLASIVALSSSGVAISGMTRPDGTYEINGIPPGQYYVYAHPLPPAQLGEAYPANITPPVDPQNDSFAANTKFITQFFPGTQDWTQASAVGVVAGKTAGNLNFAVRVSSGPAVYAMETYGYPQGIAVPAPPFVPKTRNGLVFYANGATVNNQSAMAPGLAVSVIGSAASIEPGNTRYFQDGFLVAWVDTADIAVQTPVALAVTLNGDLYVLPAAFTVVTGSAPTISAVVPAPAGASSTTATIMGVNLTSKTRILFEGVPAQVLAVNKDGSLNVAPPPALSGLQATVEAVNPDGQSSLQSLGSAVRPLFAYPQTDAVQVIPSPYILTAGTDTLLVISGVHTHFAQGQTVIGLGSSEISVRNSWVVSPEMVILNLSVSPAAQPGTTYITAATGLEIFTGPDMLTIAPAASGQATLRVPIVNALTGLGGVPAGGTALIATSGLPADLTGWTLTVGQLPAPFTADKSGVLTVQVPNTLAAGEQPVLLTAPGTITAPAVPRVILQLDPPPPAILWAVDVPAPSPDLTVGPILVTSSAPVQLGDNVTFMVYGLSAAGELPTAGALWLNVAGAVYPVNSLRAVPVNSNSTTPPPDLAYVSFVVPKTLLVDPAVNSVPVMVGTGTRLSNSYLLNAIPLSPAVASQAP